MKLATFRVPGRGEPLAGEVVDERVIALRDGAAVVDVLARPALAERSDESWQLSEVELLAPVPAPGTIYAIGLNYARHAEEQGADPPETPIVFVDRRVGQSKMSRAIFVEALLKVWRLRFSRRVIGPA